MLTAESFSSCPNQPRRLVPSFTTALDCGIRLHLILSIYFNKICVTSLRIKNSVHDTFISEDAVDVLESETFRLWEEEVLVRSRQLLILYQ